MAKSAAASHTFDPADIFQALNRVRVKYMVVGGVAAIYHGVPRTTLDVDLAVELVTGNLTRLDKALRQIGFETRIPADVSGLADSKTRRYWIREKNLKAFSYVERTAPFRSVDILVTPLSNFDALYLRRAKASDGRIKIPIIPRSALIEMKLKAGRPQALEDVAYLRAAEALERKREENK